MTFDICRARPTITQTLVHQLMILWTQVRACLLVCLGGVASPTQEVDCAIVLWQLVGVVEWHWLHCVF